ncbi:MAG: hypothetical protein PVG26_04475 [Desulfobacterales bacterium]|jgi:hypothetical protein
MKVMCVLLRRLIMPISVVCILAALVLFSINIIGLYRYTTVENGNPLILANDERTLSEGEFWQLAERRDGESDEDYAARMTHAISDRILLMEPKYLKPTFFQNWILWLDTRNEKKYEWSDSQQAIRTGGGYCSQHAIIFNNLLEANGVDAQILGLSGHVVNQAFIDGKWRVYDPDYDVIMSHSLEEVEQRAELAYIAYKNAGQTDSRARGWAEIYSSADNNSVYENTRSYKGRAAFEYEKAALLWIWLLPSLLLAIGLVLYFIRGLPFFSCSKQG